MSTKGQSNAATNKLVRYQQIRTILKEAGAMPLTARNIMLEMLRRGYIPCEDMNFARPRLTEMKQEGEIVTAGTVWDCATQRNVTAYRLAPTDGNGQLRLF